MRRVIDHTEPADPKIPTPAGEEGRETTLDEILQRQIRALSLLTTHIAQQIMTRDISKETAQQLATCIKVTMDLKAKENEMLESLSDEDLARLTGEAVQNSTE